MLSGRVDWKIIIMSGVVVGINRLWNASSERRRQHPGAVSARLRRRQKAERAGYRLGRWVKRLRASYRRGV